MYVVVFILELLEASIPLMGVAPVPLVLPPFARLAVIGASIGEHHMLLITWAWKCIPSMVDK